MIRAAVIALTLTLAACGTIEGVGKDISSGAREVQSWF
ncbi:hypothetical protein [Tropicibacter naphthalenivorans]|uniref:Putative small secreted protein n=1 Tax=Tropicibacter naphthalenivorans TaxID=441103 RepID=A0A0P1GQH3_9RHOB|nr:hypothetical protein [Tropicibacter naphthalenivorans]CUH77492.1 putative small secreted protein [Tropicibacter naphthalenivorans]